MSGIRRMVSLAAAVGLTILRNPLDRKSTRLNSSHTVNSYAVFCLKKKKMLSNSVVYAAGSALLGTVLGAFLAWIVARTNTPGKALVELFPLYAILVPTILKIVAWI